MANRSWRLAQPACPGQLVSQPVRHAALVRACKACRTSLTLPLGWCCTEPSNVAPMRSAVTTVLFRSGTVSHSRGEYPLHSCASLHCVSTRRKEGKSSGAGNSNSCTRELFTGRTCRSPQMFVRVVCPCVTELVRMSERVYLCLLASAPVLHCNHHPALIRSTLILRPCGHLGSMVLLKMRQPARSPPSTRGCSRGTEGAAE